MDDPTRPAASLEPAPRARLAARLSRGAREARILALLAEGASTKAIADHEGLSVRRARVLVNEALARRETQPPSGFVQLQARRLGEALEAALSAMRDGDLEAIDRVVRIVRELDRYALPDDLGTAGDGARRDSRNAPSR